MNLPTLAEVEAARKGKPIEKGPTRLESRMEEKKLTTIDEKAFKASVWHRDRKRCRSCGRKVEKVLGRVPERGEVHHIHGRVGDLRFEVKAALLLCLKCHEWTTGKVNKHKLVVIPTVTFATRQGTFTDASYPVIFKEAV